MVSLEDIFTSLIKAVEFVLNSLKQEIAAIMLAFTVLTGKSILNSFKKRMPILNKVHDLHSINKQLIKLQCELNAHRVYVVQYKGEVSPSNERLQYSTITEVTSDGASPTIDYRQNIFIKPRDGDGVFARKLMECKPIIIEDSSRLKNEEAMIALEEFAIKSMIVMPIQDFKNITKHGLVVEYVFAKREFSVDDIKEIQKTSKRIRKYLYK